MNDIDMQAGDTWETCRGLQCRHHRYRPGLRIRFSVMAAILGWLVLPSMALAQYAAGGGTYTEGTRCVGNISIGSNAPGLLPNATGCDAIAIGIAAKANSGIGGGNNTTQYSAPIALGAYSSATGLEAIALGQQAAATGNLTTAVGNAAIANGIGATVLGASTSASASNATAVGSTSRASNINATAIGFNANASGRDSLALGSNAVASGSLSSDGNPGNGFALAIGSRANSAGSSSISIGGNSLASGTKALALGDTASSSATRSVAIGANASSTISGAVAIGNGATASANVGDVSLGAGSSTAAVVITSSITVGGNTYAVAGSSPTSTVSVGTAVNQRTITNVAAGQVNATSTDAVNGSELYATNQQVGANTANIASNTTAINNLSRGTAGLGTSMSSVLGGSTSYNASTGEVAGDFTYGGNTYGSVQSVFNAITGDDTTAGIKYFHANSVAPEAQATGVNSVAIGPSAVSSGSNSVAMGTHATASGDNATAIGAGSSATGNGSTSVGDHSMASANDAVALGQGSVADRAGTVSVGTAINTRQITSVTAGTQATDAVNVGQLNTGMEAAKSWAKDYTDQRFQAIDRDLNAVANRANAGVASGIAIASLGQAYQPNLSTVGVGVGSYHGEAGIAVGLSTISESGRYIFKVAATSNTRGDTGLGGSVNLAW
ncbi:MAG: YadA-like family protein [Luteibacter sp.]